MNDERDRLRELAGRVARRLSGDAPAGGAPEEAQGGELSALRSSLSEIQRRLAHIESHLTREGDCGHGAPAAERTPARQPSGGQPRAEADPAATPARPMWLSGTYVPATAHPSQERFNDIGEAVSELVDFFEREKTCNVEPGGKPCDHCGMCNARGF